MEFYAKAINGPMAGYKFIGRKEENQTIKVHGFINRFLNPEDVEIIKSELLTDLSNYNLRYKRTTLTGLHKVTFKDGYLQISKPKGKKPFCKFEFNSITEKILNNENCKN